MTDSIIKVKVSKRVLDYLMQTAAPMVMKEAGKYFILLTINFNQIFLVEILILNSGHTSQEYCTYMKILSKIYNPSNFTANASFHPINWLS